MAKKKSSRKLAKAKKLPAVKTLSRHGGTVHSHM
jgi:hypothetical protein